MKPDRSLEGVIYPSYKSLDELIDVETLKSLDAFCAVQRGRHANSFLASISA